MRRRVCSTALIALVLIGACRDDSERSGDTTVTMLGDAGDTAGPAPPLSDANILALIDASHAADSAAGAIASSKAASTALRNYARRMVREHHSLRVDGERVARSLRITPQLPPGDESHAETQETIALLTSTTRGGDFDKAYVDHEVAYHLDVLETVTRAMELARATELKQYIQKLAPILQMHYDAAKQIQADIQ